MGFISFFFGGGLHFFQCTCFLSLSLTTSFIVSCSASQLAMTQFWSIWNYLCVTIIFETQFHCASTSGCTDHSHSVWLSVWLTCVVLLFLFYLSWVIWFPVYFFMSIFAISVLEDCILFWFLISYKSSFCGSTGCFCVHSIHL